MVHTKTASPLSLVETTGRAAGSERASKTTKYTYKINRHGFVTSVLRHNICINMWSDKDGWKTKGNSPAFILTSLIKHMLKRSLWLTTVTSVTSQTVTWYIEHMQRTQFFSSLKISEWLSARKKTGTKAEGSIREKILTFKYKKKIQCGLRYKCLPTCTGTQRLFPHQH